MRSKNFYKQGRIGLSTLLIISLLVASGGFWQSFLINKSNAAALSVVKATLSTSAPNASSSVDVRWVTNTAISGAADKTITIDFDNLFLFPDFASSTDVDLLMDGTDSTCGNLKQLIIGTATSTDTWTAVFATSTDTLTLTYPGGSTTSTPTNICMSMRYGANATYTATGRNFTNPAKVLAAGTADVYVVAIGGTLGDSANAMVAIIEGVTVSATVTESLSFSMTGVTTGSCTGDSGTPTVRDTSGSSTTIPFGSIGTANAFFVGCHRLSVSTNGANGFATTIEENKPLKVSSSTISDTTCDGAACSETTTSTWATATNNGFGYSCENISGNGLCSDGSGSLGSVTTSYRNIACTGSTAYDFCNGALDTKQTFMSTSSPVSAQDVKVHYKLSVTGLQAAGAYSNTVTYIATPVF